MSRLSHSRRRTWVLAVGVWLAACAGLWWAAPVAPMSTLAFDFTVHEFAFHPDGQRIVTLSYRVQKPKPGSPTFDAWDIHSGRSIGIPLKTPEVDAEWPMSRWIQSSDPRWWCLVLSEHTPPRVRVFDVANWRFETLMEVPPRPGAQNQNVFSTDGQLLLIESKADNQDELIVWDLVDHRVRAKLRGASCPADAARAAGVVIAAVPGPDGKALGVFHLDSGELLRTLPTGDLDIVRQVQISGTGTYAAATYVLKSDLKQNARDQELRCWDVRAGTFWSIVPLIHDYCHNFHDESLVTLATNEGSHCLRSLSAKRGEPNWSVNLRHSHDSYYIDQQSISPDSRLTALYPSRDGKSWLVNWLFQKGFLTTMRDEWNGKYETTIHSADDGRIVYNLPATPVRWSPDGRRVATFVNSEPRYHSIAVWDLPPRKSLPWFFTGAAVLTLPIAFLAWRRSKRFAGDRV